MEESTIELIDILRFLKRRFKFILATVVVFVLAAAIINYTTPPVYEASLTLRAGSDKTVTTYSEIIKSKSVMNEAVKRAKTGDGQSINIGSPKVIVKPVKGSDIMVVKVEAGSSQGAKLVATGLVDSFIDSLQEMQSLENSLVRKSIEQQLDKAKKELEENELKLQTYKKDHQIEELSNGTKPTIEKLVALDKLSGQNVARMAVAKVKLQISQPFVFPNKVLIDNYKTKIIKQETQLAFLISELGEGHPEVVSSKIAIEQTKKDLNDDLERVINIDAPGLSVQQYEEIESVLLAEIEQAVAIRQKQTLNKITSQLNGEIAKFNSSEQGLVNLMRNSHVAQEKHSTLKSKYEVFRAQLTDVRIVDPASASSQPIRPKKALNLILAATIGLFSGIVIAFLYEYTKGNTGIHAKL
ncbi:MAG: GNVR domain-containing protein [Negativicutes bacterium]|nr:GNVR domain-containing protein [Negativicutes bacterium]